MVAVAAGLFLDTTPGFFSFVLTLIAGMGFLLAVGTYSARVQRTLVGVGVAIAVVTALVVGATSPRVSWFGRTITHGPRDVPTVALTFDDGPNRASTLAVRDVLDQYGVKGTFFLVGSAVDAAPEIARALVDDGQLVGSHAYEHNSWDWLDPRYTELGRSLAAMRQQLGVCPGAMSPPIAVLSFVPCPRFSMVSWLAAFVRFAWTSCSEVRAMSRRAMQVPAPRPDGRDRQHPRSIR